MSKDIKVKVAVTMDELIDLVREEVLELLVTMGLAEWDEDDTDADGVPQSALLPQHLMPPMQKPPLPDEPPVGSIVMYLTETEDCFQAAIHGPARGMWWLPGCADAVDWAYIMDSIDDVTEDWRVVTWPS